MMRRLERLRNIVGKAGLHLGPARPKAEASAPLKATILDSYSRSPPSHDNAVALFEGEWASILPGLESGGHVELFADHRLQQVIDLCGGLRGKTCLELGPLEGGHSYLMSKNGARSILSIEANQRSFFKCLITRNIFGYDATFLLGDFVPFVKNTDLRFDFTNMSGVLYHVLAPHELIADVARISDQVACWTHIYDEGLIRGNSWLDGKFDHRPIPAEVGGYRVELFRQEYLTSLEENRFCGGRDRISYWMRKEHILGLFAHLGFDTHVLEYYCEHVNGPSMNFYAVRRKERETAAD